MSSLVSLPSALSSSARRGIRSVRCGVLLLISVSLVPGLGAIAAPAGTERLIEGVAAQVGNQIILVSEVFEMSAPIEERMRAAGAPESEVAMVRREALERLIEGQLLSSVVERLELSADREEIDSAIAAIAQENGLSLDQLLQSIQSHGLAIDEYREKIRGEIERSNVVNAMVRSRVQISDEEVRAFYDERFGSQREGGEELQIRHILVLADGPQKRSPAEACRLAREAREQVTAGETGFSEIAARVSDMNPEQGGDLGWMHAGDLAGWMSDAIRTLQPGEISPVIEMPFGCNVLQLVDRREFEPIAFSQAESQIRNAIFQQKTEIEYTKWLDVLRAQTYIERKGAFASTGGLGG